MTIVNRVKRELIFVFEMLDLESISFYLSMSVIRDRFNNIIRLDQRVYIKRVAIKYDLKTTRSVYNFMKKFFDSISYDDQVIDQKIKQYQDMIESVMFAMIEIRSDVINAVFIVSRFAQNSDSSHIKAVKRIIVYLNITFERDIVYDNIEINLELQKFCDAN